MRREQRDERTAPGCADGKRLEVVGPGEAETAVLRLGLHAEGADLLEALDHLVRDLGVGLDLQRIDLLLEEGAQLGEEGLTTLDIGGVELRLRVDEGDVEISHVEALAEAGLRPVLLAGLLGDLACLFLADLRHGAMPFRLSEIEVERDARLSAIAPAPAQLRAGSGRPSRLLAVPGTEKYTPQVTPGVTERTLGKRWFYRRSCRAVQSTGALTSGPSVIACPTASGEPPRRSIARSPTLASTSTNIAAASSISRTAMSSPSAT